MDIEIIVWLVIIFFFILSRLISRKPSPQQQQRRPQQQQRPAEEGKGQYDASLDDALREIREALGGGAPREQERPAPPQPKPQPKRPEPRPSPQPRPAEARRGAEGTFHDTVLVDRSRTQQPHQQRPPAQRPQRQQRPAPPPRQTGGTKSIQERQAELARQLAEKQIGDTPIIDEVMKAYDRGTHTKKGVRKDDIMPMLSSQRALKQSIKVREILGPCRAKQPFRGGDR